MFGSVLIANRGEIACRIMRTCRRLGVRSVAVFSEADRGALFTRMADVALELGPSPPRESYLNVERILEAVRQSGAEALHPGYGFLAENAGFARACRAAGVQFIGPTAEAIEAMGLKDAAKALMQRAGVPVVPGYHGSDQSDARLLAEAKSIGFPVLIKAVAGGGGKGMRRVESAAGFGAALESARREAENAFGDARVLVEKYLAKPRHIEVQVLADSFGNTLALHERDCSLQRRHQKLIEEAPAPGVTPALRALMGQAAVAAARAVNYQSAGTVEMIADASQGLSAERFYFMEMNTRLQVEHPVTEMITGLDLVEWQLRIAAGERLPWSEGQVPLRGHSIEVRVCAEDPAADDAPRTGRLLHVAFPEGPDVRAETGVTSGDQVSVFYDSMLAKLVVWGEDRAAALRRMSQCLGQVELLGLANNVAFLKAAVEHSAFRAGDVHTALLAEQREVLLKSAQAGARNLLLLAIVGRLCSRAAHATERDPYDAFSPWREPRSFRLNAPARELLTLQSGEQELKAQLTYGHDQVEIELLGQTSRVRGERLVGTQLSCQVDGALLTGCYLAPAHAERVFVGLSGASTEVLFGARHVAGDDAAASLGAVRSPLPGRILSVFTHVGASVKRGDALVSLEAMKMEHTLHASVDGVVTELNVQPRDQVAEGSTLFVLQAAPEAGRERPPASPALAPGSKE
jgi:3-methylcrotonyl-CoA carboxylase alpha subunit